MSDQSDPAGVLAGAHGLRGGSTRWRNAKAKILPQLPACTKVHGNIH